MNSLQTFRSTDPDSDGLFLTLTRCRDRETYNRFLEGAGAAGYRERLPADLYETLATECYLIVDEVTAKQKS